MTTMADLHETHLRQLDATLAESELLLLREGGLDGELKTSGSICERFVRRTLGRFIVPGHFRITSGFVATPTILREGQNLPQCDILIVDRDTPPLLRFDESDIEVVPRESVCGILEVKRSLTNKSLDDALGHLHSVVNSFGEVESLKTDVNLNRFNVHVGFHNYSSDKPLLGVIALRNQVANFATEIPQKVTAADSLVDFVWTLDGSAMLPAFEPGEPGERKFYTHTARPTTRTWEKLVSGDFKSSASPFYTQFDGSPVWSCFTKRESGLERASVFALVRGVVTLMLSRVFGRPLQEDEIGDYYVRGIWDSGT